jgi:hypothetical protein
VVLVEVVAEAVGVVVTSAVALVVNLGKNTRQIPAVTGNASYVTRRAMWFRSVLRDLIAHFLVKRRWQLRP